MDRLLCGDVGVGKTEVALRAAFKCIMGGKQEMCIRDSYKAVKPYKGRFAESKYDGKAGCILPFNL